MTENVRQQTNEHRCILRHVCTHASELPQCTPRCGYYVQLHGLSGAGGRAGVAGVPAEYRMRTLADIEVSEVIRKYGETFTRQHEINDSTPPADRIKSLYLYSANPGTGKTTTACALINEWLVAHCVGAWRRGGQPKQQPAYFLDVNEWQTDYNGFNRPRVPEHVAEPASQRYYAAMERAKAADFAVLDDVGVRDVSDGFRGDLHAVVNHRVTHAKPTVYTSNLPLADLPRVFGEERLADRMRDMCVEIEFTGKSRRGMRR